MTDMIETIKVWKKIVRRGDYWFWVRETDGVKVYAATQMGDFGVAIPPDPYDGGYFRLDPLMKLKGVFHRNERGQRFVAQERRS